MQPFALAFGLLLIFLVLLLGERLALLLERFVRFDGASAVDGLETQRVEIDPDALPHPTGGVGLFDLEAAAHESRDDQDWVEALGRHDGGMLLLIAD